MTNAAPVDPAANANAPTGGAATTERVIVTGSYIPTAETESALPVTVYTAEVLQKLGANTPVEGLRQLPSFVGNAVTENDSNGGNGQATINLRAIGAQNTLVLVNGRRAFLGIAANAGTLGGGPDINAIPLGATARTEVLKDGASAIYGSDAVGGVVNFVLLNGPGEAPYEGAEIFMLYGNTTESDEHVRQGYIRGGVKTDKVAIAAAGEYYSKANLYSRDRAKLAGTGDLRSTPIAGEMGLNPPGIGPLGRGGLNNNSPTFAGRINVGASISPSDANGNEVLFMEDLPPPIVNAVPAGLPAQGGALVLSDLFDNTPVRTDYRRFDVPGGSDPARFNFRAFTPARPALEKANYYISGRYKVFGDAMQVYGDVMYTATRQDNGLAPSPFTIPLGGYTNAAVVVPYIDPRTGMPFGPIAPPPPGVTPGPLPVSFGQFSGAAQRAIIQNSVFNPIAGRDIFRPADPADPALFTGNINILTGQRARRPARYIAPPGTLTTLAYRLVQELGNRRSLYDSDYNRYVAGINGDLNFQGNNFISRFGYDTGLVYEQFEQRRTDSGDARRGILYNEIIAGNFNPFIGQNAPAIGVAPTYTYNPVTGLSTQTGTKAYDNVAATQRAAFIARSFLYERDWLVDAKVNAHFFPNMYNGGFDMAGGYEHREHREQSIPDPTQLAGDQLGFNAADEYSLKSITDSVFFELTFPIVTSTMNVPFV
ncbi:MAG TPA: TonB-dependent receptor plug domain-containing protein, partial [Chthoniobacterales bacterium]